MKVVPTYLADERGYKAIDEAPDFPRKIKRRMMSRFDNYLQSSSFVRCEEIDGEEKAMKIVFDLDGTICFKGMPVSEIILECLEQLKNEGHDIIFASARSIRDMLPVLHERFHSYKLIGGNGSLISKNGNVEEAQVFSTQQVKNILSVIDHYNATYLIDGNWD